MVQAIIFDMDGVLIDSFETWLKVFNNSLKEAGKQSMTKHEFIKEVWAKDLHVIVPRFFPGKKVKSMAAFYYEQFDKYQDSIVILPQVRETLAALQKKDMPMGICTNTFSALSRKLLQGADLLKYFKVVIGGDNVEKGKPEPDGILLACKKLGIQPKEAIFIGDTPYDMEAGKRAGATTVGIHGVKGDKAIDELGELLQFIK